MKLPTLDPDSRALATSDGPRTQHSPTSARHVRVRKRVDDLDPGAKGVRVIKQATMAATVMSAELVRLDDPLDFTERAAVAGFLAKVAPEKPLARSGTDDFHQAV